MRSKKAIEDGKAVRRKVTGRVKRPGFVMTPDEVVATIKWHIRKTMGDWMENNAKVYGKRGGVFFIKLPYRRPLNVVADDFWRNEFRRGTNLRRHSIGLALRAMHGEVLTDG